MAISYKKLQIDIKGYLLYLSGIAQEVIILMNLKDKNKKNQTQRFEVKGTFKFYTSMPYAYEAVERVIDVERKVNKKLLTDLPEVIKMEVTHTRVLPF